MLCWVGFNCEISIDVYEDFNVIVIIVELDMMCLLEEVVC